MSESDSTASDDPAPDREVTTAGAQDLLPGAAGDPAVEAAPEAEVEPATELPPTPDLDLDLDADPAPETASAPPPAAPEPFDMVAAALERLEDRLEESQRLLARQSEIASSLHAENQRLKAGELRRALLPLVRDIMRVHDDLNQIVRVELDAGADPATMDVHPLKIAVEQIVDALARNGIEKTDVTPGDAFDPRCHKAVAVAPAGEPGAHKTIAGVVKIGFAWEDGAPVRPADVRVYKHTPAAAPEVTAAPPPPTIEAQP